MFRFWLSRAASVSLREQLRAQLLLGILSGKLGPGERLPSVRALARRLRIHPNTVSAVYRALAQERWVKAQRGSGVFVNPPVPHAALQRWSACQTPANLAVVDPDPEFARILAAEISESLYVPVPAMGVEECKIVSAPPGLALISPAHVLDVTRSLNGVPYRTIELKSMADLLNGIKRPQWPALVGIVSRSTVLARWAATLLSALDFPEESVVYRNPGEPGWSAGLGNCDVIGADVIATREMPPNLHPFTLRFVSPNALHKLRSLVTQRKLSHG